MIRGAQRVEQLQRGMRRLGIHALVLRLTENVVFVTGYAPHLPGQGLVFVPAEGDACLLTVEYERPAAAERWSGAIREFDSIRTDRPPFGEGIRRILRELAREHGLLGGSVGWEAGFELVAPPIFAGDAGAAAAPTRELIEDVFQPAAVLDVTALIERTRAIKDAYDLSRLANVQAVARLGLDAFEEAAVPGATEVGVAATVEGALLERGTGNGGARDVRGYAVVSSGDALHDGWRYFRPRQHRISSGDAVMLELGTVVDGYWADHTRTVIAGGGGSRQREALSIVKEASKLALAACVPGTTGADVDARARLACRELGADQFPHHTGHGLGFRYHESLPQLAPGSDHVLQAGMVVAVEPALYGARYGGGFRHEDNAVVTASGGRPLAG